MKEQITKRIDELVCQNLNYQDTINYYTKRGFSPFHSNEKEDFQHCVLLQSRNIIEISFLESLLNQPTKVKDSELLPSHYTKVREPSHQGKGNHSVYSLEETIEGYQELVHQLRIREQILLQKLNVELV